MHRLLRPRLILAVLLLAGRGAAAWWWHSHNRPTLPFTSVPLRRGNVVASIGATRTGDIVGILIGRGASVAITHFLHWPTLLSVPAIIASVAVSCTSSASPAVSTVSIPPGKPLASIPSKPSATNNSVPKPRAGAEQSHTVGFQSLRQLK